MNRVDVLGTFWGITYDAADLDTGNEGECIPEEARIKLRKVPLRRRWAVLRHEIGHAAAFECGFQDRLVQEFGVSLETAREIEEAMMGHFLPVYCDTLERAGLLQGPEFDVAEEPSK